HCPHALFHYGSISVSLSSSFVPCSHRALHSFPTRRSSDLTLTATPLTTWLPRQVMQAKPCSSPSTVDTATATSSPSQAEAATAADRKSTRLNSSHVKISYAVFCLKKKTRPNTFVI